MRDMWNQFIEKIGEIIVANLQLSVFALSLTLYFMLRYYDAVSTAKVGEVLNLEKHEINPILVSLSKRFGLKWAMRIHWLLAFPIAIFDGVFLTSQGIIFPFCAVFFGFFHILAAINNFGLYYRAKEFGTESIESSLSLIANRIKDMKFKDKIVYILKINLSNVLMSIWNLIILFVLVNSLDLIRFIPNASGESIIYLIYAVLMNMTVLLFFPFITFGSFIIIFRRLKTHDLDEFETDDHNIVFSIDVLEKALNQAKIDEAKYIRFQLPEQ